MPICCPIFLSRSTRCCIDGWVEKSSSIVPPLKGLTIQSDAVAGDGEPEEFGPPDDMLLVWTFALIF